MPDKASALARQRLAPRAKALVGRGRIELSRDLQNVALCEVEVVRALWPLAFDVIDM